ncbi:hypothetical protein Tco_1095068 [Tanacetum coccineum]
MIKDLSKDHYQRARQALRVRKDNPINKAWEILDQIPGRATASYSHSQVMTIDERMFVSSDFGYWECQVVVAAAA